MLPNSMNLDNLSHHRPYRHDPCMGGPRVIALFTWDQIALIDVNDYERTHEISLA